VMHAQASLERGTRNRPGCARVSKADSRLASGQDAKIAKEIFGGRRLLSFRFVPAVPACRPAGRPGVLCRSTVRGPHGPEQRRRAASRPRAESRGGFAREGFVRNDGAASPGRPGLGLRHCRDRAWRRTPHVPHREVRSAGDPLGRSDTGFGRQWTSRVHEIERLHRMRKGEGVPPRVVRVRLCTEQGRSPDCPSPFPSPIGRWRG